jgi:hypothetical protein
MKEFMIKTYVRYSVSILRLVLRQCSDAVKIFSKTHGVVQPRCGAARTDCPGSAGAGRWLRLSRQELILRQVSARLRSPPHPTLPLPRATPNPNPTLCPLSSHLLFTRWACFLRLPTTHLPAGNRRALRPPPLRPGPTRLAAAARRGGRGAHSDGQQWRLSPAPAP